MLRKTVVAGAAPRMEELVKHLEDKYRSRDFEVQVLDIFDGAARGKLFQTKEVSQKGWLTQVKNVTGLGTAATVKLLARGHDDLEVEVTGGKWLDKAAAGAVSLVVLWPLIVTAAVGAWKQSTLLDEIYKDVALFLAGHSPVAPAVGKAPPPNLKQTPEPRVHCPNCGGPTSAGAKFCGNCGTKLI
ncbi:MAG: zinc ribbon domain-containing protein [Gammaproteobacteria bacterium]